MAGGIGSEPFFHRYGDRLDAHGPGLREAQRGAIWAMASHWTTTLDPAQVVLPTGVGKTLVMTAMPFIARPRRVLVVSPSVVVREQLIEAFTGLMDLKRAEALSHDVPEPKVQSVIGGASAATWVEAANADVVIGNVHSISPHFERVQVAPPSHLFDLVLVDEAHHSPADAWRVLLEATACAAVLFTATPFRADRLSLPGEVVYNYPLRKAIDAGVYQAVDFVPVQPAAGHDKDATIADAAAERLRSPQHTTAGSRLIARTDRVPKAEALIELYAQREISLGLVVSATKWPALTKIFSKVRSGDLDGIVCVGSLTEGFNMPALRIAAYHAPHKTLAPTLQFIGRLARPGLAVNGELLASLDDVREETDELYREDAAWAELLPQVFDAAVATERATRRFVGEATWRGKPLAIPPLAVAPPRSARIFRTADADLNLDVDPARLGQADVVWRFQAPSATCSPSSPPIVIGPLGFVPTSWMCGDRSCILSATSPITACCSSPPTTHAVTPSCAG